MYQVKVLQKQGRIKTCRDFEEEEGRVNCNLTNRLVILGGPLVQAGPGLQQQLVSQVSAFKLLWFYGQDFHVCFIDTFSYHPSTLPLCCYYLLCMLYNCEILFCFQASRLIKAIDPTLSTHIKFNKQFKAKRVVYDIKMYNPVDSQAIRDAFGLYFRKKSGKRLPESLKGITVSNMVTFPTHVRIHLLKEVCRLHQSANPFTSCFMTNYLPRPELKIRDRKGPVVSLSYTKTVQQMSHHLTTAFLTELSEFARSNLPEKEVRDRFLVLSLDFIFCNPTAPLNATSSLSMDTSMPMGIPSQPSSQQPAAVVSQPTGQTPTPTVQESSALGAPLLLDWTSFEVDPVGPNAIVPIQLSQPGPSSRPDQFLSQSTFPANVSEDDEPLKKRNCDRFAKKSAPYPLP